MSNVRVITFKVTAVVLLIIFAFCLFNMIYEHEALAATPDIPQACSLVDEDWDDTNDWTITGSTAEISPTSQLHLIDNNDVSYVYVKRTDLSIPKDYSVEFKAKIDDFAAGYPGDANNYTSLATKVLDGTYRLMLSFDENGIYAMTNSSDGLWTMVKSVAIDCNWHTWNVKVNNGSAEVYMDTTLQCKFNLQMAAGTDEFAQWTKGTSTNMTEVHIDYTILYNEGSAPLPMTVGCLDNDTSPTSGSLENFEDYSTSYAIDYQRRSVGGDFGAEVVVNAIEMIDRDDSTTTDISDYNIYVSDDNSTYNLVSDVSLSSGTTYDSRLIYRFEFPAVSARYIKINTTYTGTNYTFALHSLKDCIRAYGVKGTTRPIDFVAGYLDNDTSPTSGEVLGWDTKTPISVDYLRRSIGIDVGSCADIREIEIWDSNNSTRCTSSSYTVYSSDDNATYTQVTGITFSSRTEDGKSVHTFKMAGVDARYIKINTTYTDANYTFVLDNMQSDIKVFGIPEALNSLPATVGYLNSDTSPTSGQVSNWGHTSTAIAVDYQDRSIGVDLSTSKKVNRIELWDNNASTRCNEADYVLYYSNNNSTYTAIPGVIFNSRTVEGKVVHTFEFTGLTARYIKINSQYSDTSYTFVLDNIQVDVKAYAYPNKSYKLPSAGGYVNSDSTPTSGVLDDWSTSSSIDVDYYRRSVGVDLGCVIPVDAIELWDSDTTTRTIQSDYELYRSNDNSTYTEITGWTFSSRNENGENVHRFEFSSVDAKYIKVHCTKNDANSNFTLDDIDNDIKVFSSTEVESSSEIVDPTRNAEQDIIILDDGSIYMGISTLYSPYNDFAPGELFARISTDNGYTWGNKFQILSNEGLLNTRSISLMQMQDGKLGMFYLRKNSYYDCRIYFRTSDDGGINWSDPKCVTPFGLVEETWDDLDDWTTGAETTEISPSGQLHLSDANDATYPYVSRTDIDVMDQYTIEFKAKIDNYAKGYPGDQDNFTSLGTKVCDGSRRLMLSIDDGGIYAITSTSNGEWTRVKDTTIDSDWHTWRVLVTDDHAATVYMDNVSQCTFTLQPNAETEKIMQWSNGDSSDSSELHIEYTDFRPTTYAIINNGRAVRLPSGRILLPVAYADDAYDIMSGEGESVAIYSDDDGVSWAKATGSVTLGNGALEPGFTQLNNGDILMNIRTRYEGKVYQAVSDDNGMTWSAAAYNGLQSPSAPSTVKKVLATDDLIIFWDNRYSTTNIPRNPLTVARCQDGEGQVWGRWYEYKTLEEPSADREYAYLVCKFVGRQVIMVYERNWANKVRIVDIDWFYNNYTW